MDREPASVKLIGTPIGNLGDITYRAVDCIKNADIIACEDTRHSVRLLSHFKIRDKELTALHEHNEEKKAPQLIDRVLQGETMVFLSDAGMPTISDPGYRLVNACIAKGVKVEVIPGPCAVTTGLAGSGMPTDAFYFGGFLPVKSGRRQRILSEALNRVETSVFFESPYRLQKSLDVLAELDFSREICVARELTKKFETFHRGTSKELAEEFRDTKIKGELTLIIRGCGRRKPSKSTGPSGK